MEQYYNQLSQVAKDNMAIIISRAKKRGITNPYSVASILSIVSKESGFIPKSESLYYTAPERLRAIFGNEFPTVESAKPYVKNEIATANKVYGGEYGNNTAGDGYKYRGRGFNQLTYKSAYKFYGDKIGVDLVNNPDLLNNPSVAADVMLEFFIESFKTAPKNKLALYKSTGINDFKTLADSVGAFYHANAGWGHSVAEIKKDTTGGRALAVSRSTGLYAKIANTVSENKGATGGALFFLALAALAIYKRKSIAEFANKIFSQKKQA